MTESHNPPFPRNSLTWLGHSTVRIELDGVTVLTDPVLRSRIGPIRRYAPRPSALMWEGVDIVLLSHLHRDHLDFDSLRMLGPDLPLVVPEGAGRFVERAGFRAVEELVEGDELSFGGIAIAATHAAHNGFRLPSGPGAATLSPGARRRGRRAGSGGKRVAPAPRQFADSCRSRCR